MFSFISLNYPPKQKLNVKCQNVETHIHRYQGEGGWRFELNEVKLDEERTFLVIESALRSMGIIIIKMDLSLQYKEGTLWKIYERK